jgi:hypothetical protein
MQAWEPDDETEAAGRRTRWTLGLVCAVGFVIGIVVGLISWT